MGLFVKNRRLTRSSKKTGKTDLSGYIDEVTDVIMGAIEITQNSCLRVLLEPQSMALILDKLPEDVLKEHREQKWNKEFVTSKSKGMPPFRVLVTRAARYDAELCPLYPIVNMPWCIIFSYSITQGKHSCCLMVCTNK